MIRTPAHKQTDPNKAPGMVRDNEGKVTFEEWWNEVVHTGNTRGLELSKSGISKQWLKSVWNTAQENT